MNACTDQQIAQAIGDTAIIAGAIAIGATTHCEAGYQNVCHSYVDFFGNTQTECDQEYNSCAVLVPNGEDDIQASASLSSLAGPASLTAQRNANPAAVAQAALAPKVSKIDWGKTFNISYSASAQIISACEDARDHQAPASLYALGLTEDDLQNMSQYKLPSEASIDAMARKLNASPAAIQSMMKTLLANSQSASKT
jgi:hypothetical protein